MVTLAVVVTLAQEKQKDQQETKEEQKDPQDTPTAPSDRRPRRGGSAANVESDALALALEAHWTEGPWTLLAGRPVAIGSWTSQLWVLPPPWCWTRRAGAAGRSLSCGQVQGRPRGRALDR